MLLSRGPAVAAVLSPVLMCGLLAACISASTTGSGTRVESRAEEPSTAFGTPLTDGPSWAPAVRTTDGLASVATSTASGFRLHTASGDKTFVPGMNLGSTTPTHQPGELAMTAADYRRWFTDMGAMGVRAVRIYTIHPPAFYDELATYNQEHPEAPLYLVQGVYLPDESYVEPGNTLYDRAVDEAFSAELADASRAVHGDLTRAPAPGHASGTWKSDVSGWVMAWIVGVEDYRIDVRPRACTARVSVASPLDPVRPLARRASDRRPGTGAYVPFALMVNRQLDSGGVSYAPEFQGVGRLRQGSWEPADRRYDSLATWQVDRAHDTVRLSGSPAATMDWTWPTWNHVKHTERVKQGADVLADAFRATGR